MPLLNTLFQPGQCRAVIAAMPQGPRRDIAMAEYCYFSGQAEKAVRKAELYLTYPDWDARLSACLIYAYANLTLGQIQQTRVALTELQTTLTRVMTNGNQGAAAAFVSAAAAPPLTGTDAARRGISAPAAARAEGFCFVCAGTLSLSERGLCPQCRNGGGGADHGGESLSHISHLSALSGGYGLHEPEADELAKEHLLEAWRLARPDDLIEGFGEHHGLLGGMLEAVIKPGWPRDFERIIRITYRFFSGWRKIHNPDTGDTVADNLSTTEFAIAMLAARGWTNQEIADHLRLSPNTVNLKIPNTHFSS